ncbi:acyltransferase [Modestobacter sp. NPDC049651]|uniref:acyltransferase family protein n=1 Tax=unclassified Modestobacter TaxID=2643866 RepID=UPI003405A4F2
MRQETTSPARARGRLAALDGLRFLAALAVVAFHFTGRMSPAWDGGIDTVFPTLSKLTVLGCFGPYLFFMISGFVVLMSAWGRPVAGFLASRVGRLFPAYWLAVVVTGVVLFTNQTFLAGWEGLGLPGVTLNLTMFQSAFGVGHVDGVYWTLWAELKFYLILALIAVAGITRSRMLLLCLTWPVLGALARTTEQRFLTEVLMPDYAPFFCIGVLLYLAYRDGWGAAIGLLLGLNYVCGLWAIDLYYIPETTKVAGIPAGSFATLAVLFTLCIAAIVVVTMTRVSRIGWGWLTTLGALTYPLYLLHEINGWTLIRHLQPVLPAYANVAVTVLVLLLLAHLTARFVEKPLGNRLRRAVERDLGRSFSRLATVPAGERAEQAPPAAPAPQLIAPAAPVAEPATAAMARPLAQLVDQLVSPPTPPARRMPPVPAAGRSTVQFHVPGPRSTPECTPAAAPATAEVPAQRRPVSSR